MRNIGFITRLDKTTGFGNYTRQRSLMTFFQKHKVKTLFCQGGIDNSLVDQSHQFNVYEDFPEDDYCLVLDLPPATTLTAEEKELIRKAKHSFWIVDDSSEESVFLDKVGMLSFPSSIINVSFREYAYQSSKKSIGVSSVDYYSGSNLVILRDSYNSSIKYKLKEYVNDVLICMGGSDPYMLTEQVVDFLSHYRGKARFTIVLGRGVDDERYNVIKDIIASHTVEFRIDRDVKDMAPFLVQFDLAIINGGILRFELGYFGIPFISIPFNDKQRDISLRLEKMGIGVCLDKNSVLTERGFIEAFGKISGSYDRRYTMHTKMQQSIQNKGTEMIYKIVRDEIQKTV